MRSNHTYLNYKYLNIVITAITLTLLLTLTPLTHTTATTEPQIEWEKTFGGAGDDRGFSVQQTSDGGYIIVGWTTSYGAGGADVYLIKVDANGNMQWSRTFGGRDADWGYSVQQTSDGGYIIVGETTSYGAGLVDVYLIKVDAKGNMQWNKTFGGAGYDWGYSVQQTSDGGYIIVGATSYGAGGDDVYLIKVDANGNMQWSKTFGGAIDDWGYSVQQTSDGGYIIVGTTTSYGAGGGDVYLIKVDANGNMQWSKTFGGAGDDRGFSVQQTSDGGYIIVGTTTSYGAGWWDVYLIKLGLRTIPTTTTVTVTTTVTQPITTTYTTTTTTTRVTTTTDTKTTTVTETQTTTQTQTTTVTTTVTQPITTTYTTTTTATRVTTTTDTKTTTVTETQTTTQTQTTTATTTVTQAVPTFYTITKTETVHITSPLTTTITSPYTTTITQTIPATITTTLHKTETQTLTTTATTPTIITVKEVITVKEATYIPTATTTTIERPLFSEETVALGISIAIVTVSTLIGLRLRR